ncbi:MAG: translation initiation factor IF-1 [Planctomycetota bacterium]|nr:translation initiation factor IF-1 [Planctomycetota bacterium]
MSPSVIRIEALVVEVLPGGSYGVELPNGQSVTARVSGQLRMNYVRIDVGDRVTVEMSPVDSTKVRIIFKAT